MGRGGGSSKASGGRGGGGGSAAAIPEEFRPAKLGAMKIDVSARNEELSNFLEQYPDAKLVHIPITGALRTKVEGFIADWRRTESVDVAKVRSILGADRLPAPIVHFYPSGTVGIPDGFHRIAAFVLKGRTSIRGYVIGDMPK